MSVRRLAVLLILLLVDKEIHASSNNVMVALRPDLDEPLDGKFFLGTGQSFGTMVYSLLDKLGLNAIRDFLDQVLNQGVLYPVIQATDEFRKIVSTFFSDPVGAFRRLFVDYETIVHDLHTIVTGHLTCAACLPLVGIMKLLLAAGTNEDHIGEVITQICIAFKIQEADVCRGIIKSQQHMLLFSIKHTPYNVPEICEFLVGNGCGTEPAHEEWQVMLPPKPPTQDASPPEPSQASENVLKFIHLTDPHVDNNYTEGSPSDCPEPLCCRENSSPSLSNIFAGQFGGAVECDIPFNTLRAIFQHIKDVHGHIDGIFWTGDLPPHNVWTETVEDHMFYNEAVDNILKEYFPDAKVYPAIGNHDSAPSNSFPIESPLMLPGDNGAWLYNQAWNLWNGWLPESAKETVQRAAFYSVQTNFPGLRVISLNNNICYFANWWLLINATDPFDQLDFLIQELTAAELAGEKVILLMHVPPGTDDCLRVWSRNFYDIVIRFADTIVCQVSGHTHWDNFMVYYDENENPTNVMHVSPALTTYDNLNIGYKVFLVDATPPPSGGYTIQDIETYYMPLDESNANGDAQFQHLYSAREAYDMKSMEPSEWNEVIEKLRTDTTYWDRFYENYSRKSPVFPGCDRTCRKGLICQLMSAKSRDPTQCKNLVIPHDE